MPEAQRAAIAPDAAAAPLVSALSAPSAVNPLLDASDAVRDAALARQAIVQAWLAGRDVLGSASGRSVGGSASGRSVGGSASGRSIGVQAALSRFLRRLRD